MDITSFAISIADLYTTCRDGCNFFTTVQKAEAEALTHVRELEIQQSILKSWGFLGRLKVNTAASQNTPITPAKNRPNFRNTSQATNSRPKAS